MAGTTPAPALLLQLYYHFLTLVFLFDTSGQLLHRENIPMGSCFDRVLPVGGVLLGLW